MIQKILSSRTLALVGALAFALSSPVAMSNGGERTYEVTITNLTAGQPLTPPVLATHTKKTNIFKVTAAANNGVRQIAENGNNQPLVDALEADSQVYQVVQGNAPIVPGGNPGGTPFESSATVTISSRGKARLLSIVGMLICTNDGFFGVDSAWLPHWKRTLFAVGYDARTERNTEDFADIVPPCQGLIGVSSNDPGTGASNPLLLEDGFIIPHPGIDGGVVDDNGLPISDLLGSVHDWSDPVAKIVIKRVFNR